MIESSPGGPEKATPCARCGRPTHLVRHGWQRGADVEARTLVCDGCNWPEDRCRCTGPGTASDSQVRDSDTP